MDSSSGEQASPSHLSPRVSVSNLVSEPMLDIDSATLELSLPEDAIRPMLQHIDSVQSQDWEDVDKFDTFTDFDSISDSLPSNSNFPQQMDFPYLSDGNSFHESALDNYPSDISKDDRLGQLVRNAQNRSLLSSHDLESLNSLDINKNSNGAKNSSNSNYSENDNEAPISQPVSDGCENVNLEGAVNSIPSDGMVQSLQAHPEYTENFHNYKVCRVIAPGVKECLILETGEQVKCDKRKKLKEIEEKLKKSIFQSENSSSENPSIVTVVQTAPPPRPPPLNPSPSPDNDAHPARAPTPPEPESNFNRSQASASSDKENVDSEVCMSPPPPRKKDKTSENAPSPSPLGERQVSVNSCDEDGADSSGQDKLSKKVFKINKPHVEDSAVYFGNLKLGRGMNKGCPRSIFFGSCPKNKVSPLTSQESKTEESEDQKMNRNPSDFELTTDEDEPFSPLEPLSVKTSAGKMFFNLDDINGLSPTGYYSDPCQTKGTSWSQHLNLGAVDVGKSFDELHKDDPPQHSLVEMYRSISNKQNILTSKGTPPIPVMVTHPSSPPKSSVDSELAAPSKSGPVPNFKSLQERQVTWMLHQLEEQHLKTMKQQYDHHQRNIQKIQEDMEAEILNQQASFQQKIKTSKSAIMKEAFGQSVKQRMTLGPTMGHPNFNSYDADIDLSDTEEDSDENLDQEAMSSHEQSRFVVPPTDNLRPQASQGNSKLSPVSTGSGGSFSPLTEHSSLTSHRLQSPLDPGLITDGRILQGGVYATPFPLSKNTLLLKSPTLTEISSKAHSPDPDAHFQSVLGEDFKSETALLQELEQRHNQRMQQQQRRLSTGRNFEQLTDDQFNETLGLLNLNDSRGNLREKHAKHLSDLRLYYEKEIKELRDALSNTDCVSSQSAYKKLVDENLLLTKKCQNKEEELAQEKARDYEQQVRAYQSQLKTYAQRCTNLEKLLSDFKHQLYQETAHNHRKETRLKELETEHLKQNSAIEDMIKLVTRYEKLEKEYNIIKESLTIAEERYFDANAEILYVKRENARLDFDNKRLLRENENLCQKIGSFKFFGDQETESLNNASVNNSRHKSPRSSQRNLSSQTLQAELDLMKEVGGKELSEAFENQFTSPIMAAERELRKLRSSKSKLSALAGGKSSNSITDIDLDLPEGILVDLPLSIATKAKAKTNQRQLTKETKSKSNATTSHHSGTESLRLSGKNKVPLQPKEVNNSGRYDIRLNDVSNSLVKDQQPPASLHQDKSNNSGSADKGMESRMGPICSQPEFEDLYSSLTKVQNQLETSPIAVTKTHQKFQVTFETIKKLEERYDGLTAEKMQVESALSRIPMSGRVDRKARLRKDDLEKKLDAIERELGSVRMSLKRFNVLKSSI